MKPRHYQIEAIEGNDEHPGIMRALQECSSTLLVMATGLGKTITFAHTIQRMPERRWMVLAHREELIRQAADKIAAVTGKQPEIEMADERADVHFFRRSDVIVSSIQTQCATRRGVPRMEKFKPEQFNLIIDEAHHAPSPSYRKVIEYYRQGGAKILGVTATPKRADEKALGMVFGSVAYTYEIADAIRDGWLVCPRQRYVEVTGLDFSSIKTLAGDLNQGQLAELMEQERPLHEVAAATRQYAQWRKALLFTVSVAQADRVAEILNRHRSGCADWVCGTTDRDRRAQMLRDFRDGRFQYLSNVGVLTEGYDEPTVELISMARPTESVALYEQILGRGTRPLPGIVDGLETAEERLAAIARSRKPWLEVLDFVGNSGKHKLVSTADILGGKYDTRVVERAAKTIRDKGEAINMAEALEEAKAAIHREKEEERRRMEAQRQHVKARATYTTKDIDPFEVLDVEPDRDRGWEVQRYEPTQKQIDFLTKQGVSIEGLTRSQAGQIVGEIKHRWAAGKCTYKQAKKLRQYGYDPNMSFEEARSTLDRLAANGWRRPQKTVTA